MNKLLAGLLALAISSPAFAWGDREQGILTGIAGYWLFDKFRNMPQQQPQPRVYGGGVYNGGVYGGGVGMYPPTVPPQQPYAGPNYVYTCYVQVADPYTGMVEVRQQVCMGR